jgi:hypothetical protein
MVFTLFCLHAQAIFHSMQLQTLSISLRQFLLLKTKLQSQHGQNHFKTKCTASLKYNFQIKAQGHLKKNEN